MGQLRGGVAWCRGNWRQAKGTRDDLFNTLGRSIGRYIRNRTSETTLRTCHTFVFAVGFAPPHCSAPARFLPRTLLSLPILVRPRTVSPSPHSSVILQLALLL